MGKAKHPLCSPLRPFPKRWQSPLAGACLWLADGCFCFRFIQVYLLHWLGFFPLPSSPITFIFAPRPAACIFDKYLSSTVNAHRLKNDLWVKPEQIPTLKGIRKKKTLTKTKLSKQKLLECMLWMLHLHLWLGFHSFLKCHHSYHCSLNTVPKAWTCAPAVRKASWLLRCLLSLGWDLKELKLSLCHNSGPVGLALFAYWWFSGRAVFYFPAWTLQLYRDSFPDLLQGLIAATSLWAPPATSGQ